MKDRFFIITKQFAANVNYTNYCTYLTEIVTFYRQAYRSSVKTRVKLAYALLLYRQASYFNNCSNMKNIIALFLCLSLFFYVAGQPPAHVDKKSKEFIITPNPKSDYTIIGYQFANTSTQTMICFSTNSDLVRANAVKCQLGSYFDTNHLKEGDMIYYLGPVGTFAKMNFVHGNGKKTIFYIAKSSFVIK